MRVMDWVRKSVDDFRLGEVIEGRSPRVRLLLAGLCIAAGSAIANRALWGWSLSRSLPGDIGGGVGMVLIMMWRDRRRARRESEIPRP